MTLKVMLSGYFVNSFIGNLDTLLRSLRKLLLVILLKASVVNLLTI